jgi:hypothetical protein
LHVVFLSGFIIFLGRVASVPVLANLIFDLLINGFSVVFLFVLMSLSPLIGSSMVNLVSACPLACIVVHAVDIATSNDRVESLILADILDVKHITLVGM